MVDTLLKWFRMIAESGNWSTLVRAASKEEALELRGREQLLLPSLAQQYPGRFRVEEMPSYFVPPPILEALEQRDFAAVETALGFPASQEE